MTDTLTTLTTARLTRFINTDGIRNFASEATALHSLNVRLKRTNDFVFKGIWNITERADGRWTAWLMTSDTDSAMVALHGMEYPVYMV